MADYDWPKELPSPLQGSLSLEEQNNEVSSPADIGEGQVRLRASSTSDILSFTLLMTQEQLKRFRAFRLVVRGVYRFNFFDPVLGETKEFRFAQKPTVTHNQADLYNVGVSLIRKAE